MTPGYNGGMAEKWLRPLICPVCDEPLAEGEQTLQCARRHSFDIAREGYVNLLLRHKRLPETVGDSPEMLRARREFLWRGFFDPLSARLNALAAGSVAGQAEPVVVDVGCGEGFYLKRLAAWLPAPDSRLFGVDVAKTAVRMAAKGGGHGRYLVADVHGKLPFASQSVHILLNIFAPRHPAEFARILAPGGRLLVVTPTPAHLSSLRQTFGLLEVQAEKQAHIRRQFAGAFYLAQTETLEYRMWLDNEALLTLIQMTPSARHLTPVQWAPIQNTPHIITEASFELWQFTPRH